MTYVLTHLDVQSGQLTLPSGTTSLLSPEELAVLYFSALGTPLPQLADQLAMDQGDLEQMRGDLAERLGIADTDLAGLDLDLSNGAWPRSAVPWDQRTGAHLIAQGLDRAADDILLYVAGQGALTVGEVRSLVAQIQGGLRAEGVKRGDRVAVDATQRVESFLLACALLLEGVQIVRLGDNLGPETLTAMMGAVSVRLTFTASGAVLDGCPTAGKIIALEPGETGLPFAEWLGGFEDHAEAPLTQAQVSPTDVALVGFTSGTTGVPKLVNNTHLAIWRSTEFSVRHFGLSPDDVFLSATDFVALSGFRSLLAMPLFARGRVVFPSLEARTTPLAQALECEEYGVTCLTAVPNVLRGFLAAEKRLTPGPHPTLRLVFSGSGVLDGPTAQGFHDRFGSQIVDYYGKRELGTPAYTVLGANTTMNTGGGRAAETLIRILDDDGKPVGGSAPGEIAIVTDCIEAEGSTWYRTGDFGRLDGGNIVITGRKSDIIKTPDGQLLAPIEVETILGAHPQITEAIVFPYMDPSAVERVGAAVQCAAPSAEIAALEETLRWSVRDAIGAYKTPERILIVPEFPRIGRSKPDRRAIIASFRAAFLPNLAEDL